MIFAVNQRHLEVDHREPRHYAGAKHRLQALLDARDELLRYRAPDDLVLEREWRARRRRLGDDLYLRKLAGPTGLLLVGVAVFDTLRDLFAERDLRRADIGVDFVGALENVDLDVEMQFAHPLEDGLTALLVGGDSKRRVL